MRIESERPFFTRADEPLFVLPVESTGVCVLLLSFWLKFIIIRIKELRNLINRYTIEYYHNEEKILLRWSLSGSARGGVSRCENQGMLFQIFFGVEECFSLN